MQTVRQTQQVGEIERRQSHPWPTGSIGTERKRTDIRWSGGRAGGPVKIDRRHAVGSTGVDGAASLLEMVVTAAIGLIIHKPRIGIQCIHVMQTLVERYALAILPNQIVDVVVRCIGETCFTNGETGAPRTLVVHDYVVHNGYAGGRDTAGRVTGSHKNAAFAIVKYQIIGYHHVF